ncbi:MAG TPA: hypothetical protein VKP30_01800 [Polyangiaceae bacterium]|nr:hypothetical protein [Polyangiaceae bacterium]
MMSVQVSHTFGFAAVLASIGLVAMGCGDSQPSEQASTVDAKNSGGTASVTSSSAEKTEPRATGGRAATSAAKATGGSENDATSVVSETGGASSAPVENEGGSTGSATNQGGASSIAAGGSNSRTSRRQTSTASGGSTSLTSSTTNTTSAPANIGGNSSSSVATGGATTVGTATGEKFSFFVTSYAAIKALSGSDDGFGGDLRYGQADGLTGADKICTEVAERSMPKNGKTWRAFLSTSTVNAIDRIGEGPWYDRRGRTFALTKADLLYTRPKGADSAIINDFPNEDGVTNHAPDGTQVDNHDMITGSNNQGKLYSATAACSDWTSSAADNSKKPRVGHSWPRSGRGGTSSSTGNVEGMENWMSALDESGCGAGVNIVETGGPGKDGNIGSGGGYGGFYCFALTP